MTFITPKTWDVGEVLSAVDMNVYVRDNTNALNVGFRYVARRLFSTPGSFTFSKADPMGDGSVDGSIIRAYRIICVGGGGAGGGGKATGSGQCSPASGGCSGKYAERFALSSVYSSTVDVAVGAGGVGAAGANGGDGTASTFAISNTAARVSAPGGRGGSVFVNLEAPPSVSQTPFFSAASPIGDITSHGELGHGSLVILRGGSPASMGGNGGSGILGSGGSGQGSTTGRTDADGRGFGGGGAGRNVAVASGSADAGGNGSGGLVIVELYA
jgi:hypothetical protein